MAPNHRLNAVAFISPLNHPILIRTFAKNEDTMKAHYIAHTSLDVIEERAQTNSKSVDCYLGLLYSMEDVAIYGYITPLKVKIVVALALSDSVVRDVEVISIFKALHMAYYASISNPFLKLLAANESGGINTASSGLGDATPYLLVGSSKWNKFRIRVDEIARIVSTIQPVSMTNSGIPS